MLYQIKNCIFHTTIHGPLIKLIKLIKLIRQIYTDFLIIS